MREEQTRCLELLCWWRGLTLRDRIRKALLPPLLFTSLIYGSLKDNLLGHAIPQLLMALFELENIE